MEDSAMIDSLVFGFLVWLNLEKDLTYTSRQFGKRVLLITVEHEIDVQFNLEDSVESIQELLVEYKQVIEDAF